MAKNQVLLGTIDEMAKSGKFKGRRVGVDGSFGRDQKFLDSLPGHLAYCAEIPSDRRAFPGLPEMSLPGQGQGGRGRKPSRLAQPGQPVPVKELAADERFPWQGAEPGNGAKAPIVVKDNRRKRQAP